MVAGISQPIDPRVLATEPLSDRQLATGLLVGSASGPPGLSGGLVAFGMFVGGVRGISSVPVVALASIAFAATLLLASRSTINALGLFATRFPRAGQIVVGIMSLVIYGGFQFAPRLATGLDGNEQQRIASVLQYTPPGQLGRAIENAEQHPLAAVGHLVLGALWLPALGALFVWTTRALIVAVQRPDATGADRSSKGAARRQPIRSLARWACGRGAMGALAWRSVLTRLRTPRTALETFTGAGVGLAIVLVPALLRDEVGAGAVLVGGAVQLAVLFIAGNSFGSDGPALSNELLCGVDPVLFVRAKARSVLVVTSPLGRCRPAARRRGERRVALSAGGLPRRRRRTARRNGRRDGAVDDRPIAVTGGRQPAGRRRFRQRVSCGLILARSSCRSPVTLPVALGLFWAVSFGSLSWVTVFAGATVAAGAGVLELGIRYATRHWRRSEPEIYAAVIPTS